MSEFSRTAEGLKATFLFHRDPIVWVEGSSDVLFYERCLEGCDVVVLSAGGKTNCAVLEEEIVAREQPYVVVLDGDYEILTRKRSLHRRAIRLQKHSMENYLCEPGSVINVTTMLAGERRRSSSVGEHFDAALSEFQSRIDGLIVADVASQAAASGEKVMPKSVEEICRKGSCEINSSSVAKILRRIRKRVGTEGVEHASRLVSSFGRARRPRDLIPGRILFGFCFRFAQKEVKGRRRRNIQKEDFRLHLLADVFHGKRPRDVELLRRRLRRAIRESASLRADYSVSGRD